MPTMMSTEEENPCLLGSLGAGRRIWALAVASRVGGSARRVEAIQKGLAWLAWQG